MNYSPLSEAAITDAVQDRLLRRLKESPWLKVLRMIIPSPQARIQPDILLQLGGEAGLVGLVVEVKREIKPGDIPRIKLQLENYIQTFRASLEGEIFPMVAAPWISPRVFELCREAQISCMDLAGNMFLSVPGIRLHYAGFSNPIKPGRPSANLGSMETARILRTLLCWPTDFETLGHPLPAEQNISTQWKLRERCRPEVSIGLVNKVVQHLREEAYLEVDESGNYRVKDPVGLLKAWAKAYRFDKHLRKSYYTPLSSKILMAQIKTFYDMNSFSSVLATFSAAELQAPHVHQPKTWVYVTQEMLPKFLEEFQAKPVDSGANMEILIPADNGVFYETRRMGNDQVPQTHPVQTYVDLCHCGGRGEEAAEALLNQRLKPTWQAWRLNV